METTKTRFIDKAITGLKNAAIELEEFRLQLALGKAEASDKYEDVKKNLKDSIREAKTKLSEGKVAIELNKKFEELQVQLALGKAETKVSFNEQKEKILKTIREIETSLKKTELAAESYLKLNNEIEKFKIKMEILRLQFELGKQDAKDNFEEKKVDFAKKVDKIKMKFKDGESVVEKNWEHFRTELHEAYSHLKKAFTS